MILIFHLPEVKPLVEAALVVLIVTKAVVAHLTVTKASVIIGAVLLAGLLEALGFLVHFNFGGGHLALLGQQLVPQLQQFVLNFLHGLQQLLLVLQGKRNMQWPKKVLYINVNTGWKAGDGYPPLLHHGSLLVLYCLFHFVDLLLLLHQLVL